MGTLFPGTSSSISLYQVYKAIDDEYRAHTGNYGAYLTFSNLDMNGSKAHYIVRLISDYRKGKHAAYWGLTEPELDANVFGENGTSINLNMFRGLKIYYQPTSCDKYQCYSAYWYTGP